MAPHIAWFSGIVRLHPRNAIARPAQPTQNQSVRDVAATITARRGARGVLAQMTFRKTEKWNRSATTKITSFVLNAVFAAYRAGSGMKTRIPVATDKTRPPTP